MSSDQSQLCKHSAIGPRCSCGFTAVRSFKQHVNTFILNSPDTTGEILQYLEYHSKQWVFSFACAHVQSTHRHWFHLRLHSNKYTTEWKPVLYTAGDTAVWGVWWCAVCRCELHANTRQEDAHGWVCLLLFAVFNRRLNRKWAELFFSRAFPLIKLQVSTNKWTQNAGWLGQPTNCVVT